LKRKNKKHRQILTKLNILHYSNNNFFLEELIERLRAEIRDKDGIIEEKNEQIKKLQGQ
jgi:hypothetical protein